MSIKFRQTVSVVIMFLAPGSSSVYGCLKFQLRDDSVDMP